MKRLWILLALLCPVVASAQINSLPAQSHLLVKGEAHREVRPDRFGVVVTLDRVDPSPEVARSKVQADATNVLAAFHRHHALPGSIQAATMEIKPAHAYEEGREVFKGTEVTRRLAVAFGTLEDTRAFLGDLKTSEFLQLSGVTPGYRDEAALRATLKGEAAAQSRQAAEALAKAYGVRLSGLYTISDVAPAFSYGIQAGTWRSPESPFPPAPPPPSADVGARVDPTLRPADGESLEAGTLTLSENVYAVFLIAQ